MDTTHQSENTCPIARALARVGDSWSLLILREAGRGFTRFDQFRAGLGIAPNILTHRLTALVEAGLLEKHRYSERPPRQEYVLTERGRDFLPVLAAIGAWGRKHYGLGQTSYSIDEDSGSEVEPIVVDRATGRPLGEIRTRLVLPGEG
ncbi:helix-turn-helix transcriptional regulator [Rhizobiaceae bacterium n13]|uniref:Helix-turn-helix transcriptional regulator n=1 Tax=Ferirhizobium litorale TaxID=2927786 RepID=A0AAE3QKU0_9HYPH|nr:helix-turn-helix domain-containing protein [Fererhizobium litorale]MDI7864556.1 helix-turn-helix transcriptional regulator [Fererhizobium litorale]MDI7924903.1 helix-turn-helix transcriptional regulator [Fererhizobium litorale]